MTPTPVLPDPGWLASAYDVALLDLDGVVYVGPAAVPHAVEALAAARRSGLRLAYVTNNASRPPGDVAAHLRRLGLAADDGDVVTSAQAGARLIAEEAQPGSAVLALGGPGVAAALRERGFRPVVSDDERPVAVLQGFGPDVGWRLLAEGAYALSRGVPWVATNMDRTIPTASGTAPGNGALVELLRAHTGRQPRVAGKPEPALVRESVDRTAARRPLMVGDRLDTDIEGGVRAGIDSLLVLTGVTSVADLLAAGPRSRPTHVALDLRGLLRAPNGSTGDGGGDWRCGSCAARVDRGSLVLEGVTADTVEDGVRAACAAVWSTQGAVAWAEVATRLQGLVGLALQGEAATPSVT